MQPGRDGRRVCRTIYLVLVARFASLPMFHRLGTPFSWKSHGTPQRGCGQKSGCLKVAVDTPGSSDQDGRRFLPRPQRVPASTHRAGACGVDWALTFSMWISAQDPRRGASKLEIGLPAGVSEGLTRGHPHHGPKIPSCKSPES